MRTLDIDYDYGIGMGDPRHAAKVMISITWEIDFEVEGRGTEDRACIIKATPVSIQVMIGGMPFPQVEWVDVPKQYPFHDWVRARQTEITFEAIGYTEQEAFREACEEEDDREEESRQIGRPI